MPNSGGTDLFASGDEVRELLRGGVERYDQPFEPCLSTDAGDGA